ncbi:hypothetical protein Tco_0227605 [Tanacetum coccineum]
MTTLQFADTHNLVAFLSKPAESEGFEQIVDFLNANPIRYALTINPTIYTSCIEQFWANVKAKTVNGEVQLQALVDGKKIIITESIVRRVFNRYAEVFNSYPKQIFLRAYTHEYFEKQLEGMSHHKRIYVTPSHSKKIFGNMRRVGKGFSGRETPLFQTMVVQHQEEMGEGSANPSDPHHTPTIIQPSTSQPQKKQKPRRPKRKDTEIPQSSGPTDNVADEAVNEEMDDSLERAVITVTSLDAEHDRGNIHKTQSKATPNEPSSLGTSSGGGPRHQETMGDTIAQTRFENVSKHSNDPLLAKGNTLQSGEDRLKLKKLMEFCTKLQQRVLDLENTKTAQAQEITSLKLRVKKLEKKGGSRTHKLKRLYKVGRFARMVSSDDASLGDQEDASKQGRKIDDIDKESRYYIDLMNSGSTADPVTTAGEVVTTASPTETTAANDLTLAQTLIETRSVKIPKVKVHGKPEKPTKKKDQIRHNEEVAQRLKAQLQDELEEEDRLVRQREEEANIVSLDNVQAMIDADYQMVNKCKQKNKRS